MGGAQHNGHARRAAALPACPTSLDIYASPHAPRSPSRQGCQYLYLRCADYDAIGDARVPMLLPDVLLAAGGSVAPPEIVSGGGRGAEGTGAGGGHCQGRGGWAGQVVRARGLVSGLMGTGNMPLLVVRDASMSCRAATKASSLSHMPHACPRQHPPPTHTHKLTHPINPFGHACADL